MKSKRKGHHKGRFSAYLRGAASKCLLAMVLTGILLFLIVSLVNTAQQYDLRVGSISRYTINASKDVVDEVTTEERRKAAAEAVEPTYKLHEEASSEVLNHLATVFSEIRTVQQYGLTLRTEDMTEEQIRDMAFDQTELDYARGLLTDLTLTDNQLTTLLRSSTEDVDVMISTVTLAVENSLNTTIREGQVSQSIQNILQIVGYRVETSLYQTVVPTVLRNCVQPNMVIDQETTDAARQAARDAVEPVTYLQGQNIIREGERVTAAQLEVLRSLGLLAENEIDWTVYGGGLIMTLFAMGLLISALRLQKKELLRDPRRMCVICVSLVFSCAVCALCVKFLNPCLAPMAMCAMLLTGLVGRSAGTAATLSMTVLSACMALGSNGGTGFGTDAVRMILCTLLGGLVSVLFLRAKPQRIRVVVCGFLVAVVNAAAITAVGLMSDSTSSSLQDDAVWALGSGLLSGVLTVGIQPVLESLFNLATPSKLLELGNPNHPLLRRLLLEASGTYHHSIIVANLAEAAAERIGANPLLARTGAYFHDVGKLKRPLYFKENQMGENPHDKTDPYVSAAIVTAHTRDGVILAQKYRLPKEIQSIIAEHHGDTPVMFFYHKALEEAGGKPVDIADFRYDGHRPTSKESAIIMLADTVEAAVRSMPDPSPQAIEKKIGQLVRGKLDDGQLSDSPLTLKDIDGVCEAFARVLVGVFHERIEYPQMEAPKRNVFQRNEEAEKKSAEAESKKKGKDEKAEKAEKTGGKE